MLAFIAFSNPLVLNEVHGLAACVVAAAIAAPVLLMRRRHIEVDRLPPSRVLRRGNDHGLRQDQCWPWHISHVDTTIDAGLMDADRYVDAGLRDRRTDCSGEKRQHDDGFHDYFQR